MVEWSNHWKAFLLQLTSTWQFCREPLSLYMYCSEWNILNNCKNPRVILMKNSKAQFQTWECVWPRHNEPSGSLFWFWFKLPFNAWLFSKKKQKLATNTARHLQFIWACIPNVVEVSLSLRKCKLFLGKWCCLLSGFTGEIVQLNPLWTAIIGRRFHQKTMAIRLESFCLSFLFASFTHEHNDIDSQILRKYVLNDSPKQWFHYIRRFLHFFNNRDSYRVVPATESNRMQQGTFHSTLQVFSEVSYVLSFSTVR